MAITIDITGFYYSFDVPFDEDIKTVFDVMHRASGKRAPNGGVLSFDLDDQQKFVNEITVNYDSTSKPMTRQKGGSLIPERPIGRYSFTDNVLDSQNRVNWTGGQAGLLAWQYYVFDSGNTLKSQFGANGERVVIPATTSDRGDGAVILADGDRIVWRVVAIFGLPKIFDANMQMLVANSEGAGLSMKAAAEMLPKS